MNSQNHPQKPLSARHSLLQCEICGETENRGMPACQNADCPYHMQKHQPRQGGFPIHALAGRLTIAFLAAFLGSIFAILLLGPRFAAFGNTLIYVQIIIIFVVGVWFLSYAAFLLFGYWTTLINWQTGAMSGRGMLGNWTLKRVITLPKETLQLPPHTFDLPAPMSEAIIPFVYKQVKHYHLTTLPTKEITLVPQFKVDSLSDTVTAALISLASQGFLRIVWVEVERSWRPYHLTDYLLLPGMSVAAISSSGKLGQLERFILDTVRDWPRILARSAKTELPNAYSLIFYAFELDAPDSEQRLREWVDSGLMRRLSDDKRQSVTDAAQAWYGEIQREYSHCVATMRGQIGQAFLERRPSYHG